MPVSKAMKERVLRVRPSPAIEKHIAKALGNSLRVQILWILNERVASPSELARELGVSLNRISNHIKVLKEADCVELVTEKIVGNSVQRFYRATARVFLDDTKWPAIPATVQEGLRTTLLQNLIDDAIEAISQGIYDSLPGSHMSWTTMIVDEQGQVELARILERCLYDALDVQEGAAERLSTADAPGVSYSVSILGYPSIGGKQKVVPVKGIERFAESKKTKAKSKQTGKKRTANASTKKTKSRSAKSEAKTKRAGK